MKVLIGPTHLYHLNFLRVANIGNVMLQCCFFPINEILKQVYVYKNLDLSVSFSLQQRQILVQKYVANSKPFVIY